MSLYIEEQYIIFGFDGPTFPIILYLACECIPSSTIVQLPVLLSHVFQWTSIRSSNMSKLLWILHAKWRKMRFLSITLFLVEIWKNTRL